VRLLERAIAALVVLVVIVMAVASVLSVTKDWLVALGVHAGIARYSARVHSRLIVQDIALDLLALTAAVRGVSEALVSIESRLTDNISLLGVRDERGDVGVDVKFSLRFE
jgi:hypothetical protein